MDSSPFQSDIERNERNSVSMDGSKRNDGRKKVLIVGAGAAG